jgi:protocatechuate 3,4-dioxygenase beta subunit
MEGKPGTPLLLGCRVVDASTCGPIAKAAVDVWHCDAAGVYSGAIANDAGTNFLRGVQRTNAKGIATFATIKEPYRAHGTSPDTPNPQDAIYRNGGRYGLLTVAQAAAGYTGTITMGVHV